MDYDDWLTSPPEPIVATQCAQCDEDIYENEEVLKTDDGEMVHEDCWKDYSMSRLGATTVVAAAKGGSF